jgi:hypothetical protein
MDNNNAKQSNNRDESRKGDGGQQEKIQPKMGQEVKKAAGRNFSTLFDWNTP